MTVHKASSTDAFYVVDYDDVPASGIIRCAKKILLDGATALARAETYTFALFGITRSGASGGINAIGDGRDEAVTAAIGEFAATDGLALRAGKGLDAADVAPMWGEDSPLAPERFSGLTAASAVAATGALTTLDGASVTIASDSPLGDTAATAFTEAGATIAHQGKDALDHDADICCVETLGAIDHDRMAETSATHVVALAPRAVTTRALATAHQRSITVVPDLLTTAGPLLVQFGGLDDDGATSAVADRARAAAEGEDSIPLNACVLAEEFLSTTYGSVPFGRPI